MNPAKCAWSIVHVILVGSMSEYFCWSIFVRRPQGDHKHFKVATWTVKFVWASFCGPLPEVQYASASRHELRMLYAGGPKCSMARPCKTRTRTNTFPNVKSENLTPPKLQGPCQNHIVTLPEQNRDPAKCTIDPTKTTFDLKIARCNTRWPH